MILRMIPYSHQWALIRTQIEYIEVTCKDDNGERRFIELKDEYIIFIGSLDQCNYAIELNNR
jgi:hypothetical protein